MKLQIDKTLVIEFLKYSTNAQAAWDLPGTIEMEAGENRMVLIPVETRSAQLDLYREAGHHYQILNDKPTTKTLNAIVKKLMGVRK